MTPTLFIMGPSDIEGQGWTKDQRVGKRRSTGSAQWHGLLPILPFVMSDASLRAKATPILIGIHEKIRIPQRARLNLFNLVGDADASVTALKAVQAIEEKIRPIRCFNPPVNVFKTSRARLPTSLSGIPGCRVPRAQAVEPRSFGELEAACMEFDTWPLIVRARGYHGGDHMTLVDDKSQLQELKGQYWLYDGIVLVEFVDYRNKEGLYQKTRVVLVDGIPYPRHSIISNRWSIHGGSRSDLMADNQELRQMEEAFLAYLSSRGPGTDHHGNTLRVISDRIGLDIVGIDFSLVDGELVIFEANPCMNFLRQDYGEKDQYRYLEGYVSDLKRAVKRMLMKA